MKISYVGIMDMSAPMTLNLAAAAKVSQKKFEKKIGSCSYYLTVLAQLEGHSQS